MYLAVQDHPPTINSAIHTYVSIANLHSYIPESMYDHEKYLILITFLFSLDHHLYLSKT